MKNKISKLFKTFFITLIVAFIATENQNYVYNILDKLGQENEVFKKIVLSATITLCIGLFSSLLSFFLSKIQHTIKKMNVSISTKMNGSRRTTVKFKPVGGDKEYHPKDVEIEVNFQPVGMLSVLLIKKIGVTLDIYFNPELLDVSFFDKWDSEVNQVFNVFERKISIEILAAMDIKGKKFRGNSHKLNEQFKLKPIRVKNAETSMDLVIRADKLGKFGDMLSKMLLTIDFNTLRVSCKGEDN